MAVVLSVFAVLVLITSSSNLGTPSNQNHLSAETAPSPYSNLSSLYYPYVSNASAYPNPDALTNESGSVSLPQVATTLVGNVPYYLTTFVLTDSSNDSILAFQVGTYNASLAQTIFENSGGRGATCLVWCATGDNIPISWSPPTLVAAYGTQRIQADALAVSTSRVVVAATVNNATEVYYSASLGTTGSWSSLTGNLPITGGSPRLYTTGCTTTLTTIGPRSLLVSQLPLPCGFSIPEGEGHSGEGFGPLLMGGAPGVSAVVPFQDSAGSQVLLNGTNLNSVSQVEFGTTSAAFTSHTEPNGNLGLLATVPTGAGLVVVCQEMCPLYLPGDMAGLRGA